MKWRSYALPILLLSNQSLVAQIKINGTQLAGFAILCGGIYHLTKDRSKKEQTFRDSFVVSIGLIGCGTMLATNNTQAVKSSFQDLLNKIKALMKNSQNQKKAVNNKNMLDTRTQAIAMQQQQDAHVKTLEQSVQLMKQRALAVSSKLDSDIAELNAQLARKPKPNRATSRITHLMGHLR